MQLAYPKRIVCDWGARRRIADVLEALDLSRSPRYVLVTGGSDRYSVIREEFSEILGPPLIHFNAVPPEPCVSDLNDLTAVLRDVTPTVVIGVGGGSVIDVAKACAAIAPADGTCADFFFGRRTMERPGIPFIALPTTAGTGAEITKNSVIIDDETRVKQSIRHPFMIPAAAICDPELTVSMPATITINSGLDALTQAIEAYLTRSGNHLTRALAMKAVQLIVPNLSIAVDHPDDRMARTALCEGSLLTAMSFSQSGLGAVHGLAHPLGSLLKIPHGRCCAILLPHILEFNAPACDRRLMELAAATESPSSSIFTAAIIDLCRSLGIPKGFAEYGLNEEHFQFVIEKCRSNSMSGNPVHMTDDDVMDLLTCVSA